MLSFLGNQDGALEKRLTHMPFTHAFTGSNPVRVRNVRICVRTGRHVPVDSGIVQWSGRGSFISSFVFRTSGLICDLRMPLAELAAIRHTLDTRDPFYTAENDWFDASMPLIEESFQKILDQVLHSPFRPDIEPCLCGPGPGH